MSVFEYEALDDKGRKLKGFVDAPGVTLARQQLRERGIYPVGIRPARETDSYRERVFFQIPASRGAR